MIHQGAVAAVWATEQQDPLLGGEYWLKAASLYSIAGYPHLKCRRRELAEQAEMPPTALTKRRRCFCRIS